MSAWYFPSWNGDFRLESDPDDDQRTKLTVIDPTKQELEVLGLMQEIMGELGYHDPKKSFWDPKGDSRQPTVLQTDIVSAGTLLLPKLIPGRATLTAIRTADGEIVTVRSTEKKPGVVDQALKALVARKDERAALTKDNEETALAKTTEKVPAEKKKETKAVTVARATPCCPSCTEGPLSPATEVLFSFLTDDERSQWADEHAVVAEGNMTGHRYLLMHRHSAKARRVGWICYDMDDGHHLHFYDWSVPPEEEVLGAKLVLENAEDWLRNEATCFHSPLKFKNPFGNGNDGVEESAFLSGVGIFSRALA